MGDAFKALSDPTRRRILELLRAGPLPAGELARQFGTSAATVSHHLAVLRDAGLVPTTDFWGMWRTLKEKHCIARNVPFLQQLADYAKAAAPLEKKHVVMTWHASTEVPGNAILFPQGETWYAERLSKQCDIVADGERHFTVVVYGPTKLTASDRIQVSEGTFVRILSQAAGKTIIPVLHSPEWKSITDKGKVEVDLLC